MGSCNFFKFLKKFARAYLTAERQALQQQGNSSFPFR